MINLLQGKLLSQDLADRLLYITVMVNILARYA